MQDNCMRLQLPIIVTIGIQIHGKLKLAELSIQPGDYCTTTIRLKGRTMYIDTRQNFYFPYPVVDHQLALMRDLNRKSIYAA